MSGVMLCEFGPGIWTSRGPIISFLGFRYPTRMAVICLPNGGLFVWSPVALSTSLKKNVDALGLVRFLVSPNRLHHLYLSEWNPPTRLQNFAHLPACARSAKTWRSTGTLVTHLRSGAPRSTKFRYAGAS